MTPVINISKIKTLKLIIFLYYFFAFAISYHTVVGINTLIIPTLYDLGRIFGTLGFSGIILQMILSSRINILEKGVGLDRLSRWHKSNSRAAFSFILLHPFLLFFIFIKQFNFDFLKNLTFYEWLGIIALLLLIFFVSFTVFSNRLNIKYETWKLTHKTAYIVILLAGVHSFMVRSGIYYKKPLFYWWILVILLAAITLFLKYSTKKRRIFKITDIISETQNTRTVKLEPADNKNMFEYKPGQFAFITFLSGSLPKEQHPFTISSSPNGKFYTHTIKESGDFTNELGKLQIGDSAVVEGPYGVFSNYGLDGPFVFIAGGVGITPLMSMIEFNASQPKKENIILFNSVRTQNDIIFKDALNKLEKQGEWLRIVYIFSDEKSGANYYGHINSGIITKELDYLELYKYFICGPPNMMYKVKIELIKLGVNKDKIFTEEFKLR
ncbi:hypothetical protein A3B64_00690 [candidate division WWE3 bacterium RIFCSPLOWO2_01_FULL_37_24]|nr:MAG: hypothetical protein A3B64_00690 [candidate division WWE3 bacterium RIFCSPLOWO2_01_FULL_37_24]